MAGLLGPMMGQQMGVKLGLLNPQEEQAPDPRFWQGGDKFTGRDGLAGLLAIIGDVAAQQSGGQGNAIEGLLGGRSEALQAFEKQAEQERQLQKLIALGAANNIPENVVRAQAAGLKLPEPEKPHELQRLAALANDPTQPPEVRDAAKRKLQDDPYLTGVNLPNGGQFFGRASALPGVSGSMGGGGLTPMSPDEVKALGLPEGGPGGNRPGGFPRRF